MDLRLPVLRVRQAPIAQLTVLELLKQFFALVLRLKAITQTSPTSHQRSPLQRLEPLR
jgi:hypothetical protein